MSIPSVVEQKLSEGLWRRGRDSNVDVALTSLGINQESDFADFYRQFWGPFHSSHVGHELLDIVEQDESIVSATQTVRNEFGLADRFIIVSCLTGLSVLVYDKESEMIFDVDFEGGEELLDSGKLDPRWGTWSQFLIAYFS